MDEDGLKWDFELLDRYQGFSAEVVRLSLVTLAGFGFFLSIEKGEGERIARSLVLESTSRWLVGAGLVLLVISAATALAHRYVSSDCLFYLVLKKTRDLDTEQNAIGNAMLNRSEFTILAAAASLAVGVGCLVLAFLLVW